MLSAEEKRWMIIALRVFALMGAVRLAVWLVQDLLTASDTLTDAGLAWRLFIYVAAPWLGARWLMGERPSGVWCVARFFVFAFLPAALIFHLHQSIAYGGWLGELRHRGAGPWLFTFGRFYLSALLHVSFVVWAGDMLSFRLRAGSKRVREFVYAIVIPAVVASQINY